MNLHTATSPDCPVCLGYGRVCAAHPDLAFGPGLPRWEYYAAERVCWCGAGARPCPRGVEDDGNHRSAPPRNAAHRSASQRSAPQHNSTQRFPSEDDNEPPRKGWRSDLLDMCKWALAAAALTVVFGWVLNVLEAWL
jgi:hypothetical protein